MGNQGSRSPQTQCSAPLLAHLSRDRSRGCVVTSDRYRDDEKWQPVLATDSFTPSAEVTRYRYRFKGRSWSCADAKTMGGPAKCCGCPRTKDRCS